MDNEIKNPQTGETMSDTPPNQTPQRPVYKTEIAQGNYGAYPMPQREAQPPTQSPAPPAVPPVNTPSADTPQQDIAAPQASPDRPEPPMFESEAAPAPPHVATPQPNAPEPVAAEPTPPEPAAAPAPPPVATPQPSAPEPVAAEPVPQEPAAAVLDEAAHEQIIPKIPVADAPLPAPPAGPKILLQAEPANMEKPVPQAGPDDTERAGIAPDKIASDETISNISAPTPLPAKMPPIGRIVSVSGTQAIVLLENDIIPGAASSDNRPEMGTLVKVDTAQTIVLGLVSALSVPVPSTSANEAELRILELEFAGELLKGKNGELKSFNRGISVYPGLGDQVSLASRPELERAYAYDADDAIKIGTIMQDSSIPSMIRIDDLLGKHFSILGTTGTGKSCTTALILSKIIEHNKNAHIVMLDPHSEYTTCFGEKAEIITPENFSLPFWLLNFEEITETFIGHHSNSETDIEILRELIPLAKSRYAASGSNRKRAAMMAKNNLKNIEYSVDDPVPYRISDLIALLDENIGKLDHRGSLAPFKRLKARIEQYSRDPRYAFMFGNLTVNDNMAEILGRIFRIPNNGKPITIISLAGLPSEIISVTVSVLARMTFDFGLWSEGNVPITLVCEEAHRYVPNHTSNALEPARRAISRIAKEGRKYGISLGVITQRPSELAPTILSQCNTIFAMRLSNENDQDILRAAVSDAASSLLEFLPSMGNQEALVFGEGVNLPARIRFEELSEDAMPESETRKFSEAWTSDTSDEEYLEAIVTRWREGVHMRDQEDFENYEDSDLDQSLNDSAIDDTNIVDNSPMSPEIPASDVTKPSASPTLEAGARDTDPEMSTARTKESLIRRELADMLSVSDSPARPANAKSPNPFEDRLKKMKKQTNIPAPPPASPPQPAAVPQPAAAPQPTAAPMPPAPAAAPVPGGMPAFQKPANPPMGQPAAPGLGQQPLPAAPLPGTPQAGAPSQNDAPSDNGRDKFDDLMKGIKSKLDQGVDNQDDRSN